MKRSILPLAAGTFALGASEFVMMGVLPHAAQDTAVSIPTAGHYVSAYANWRMRRRADAHFWTHY